MYTVVAMVASARHPLKRVSTPAEAIAVASARRPLAERHGISVRVVDDHTGLVVSDTELRAREAWCSAVEVALDAGESSEAATAAGDLAHAAVRREAALRGAEALGAARALWGAR